MDYMHQMENSTTIQDGPTHIHDRQAQGSTFQSVQTQLSPLTASQSTMEDRRRYQSRQQARANTQAALDDAFGELHSDQVASHQRRVRLRQFTPFEPFEVVDEKCTPR